MEFLPEFSYKEFPPYNESCWIYPIIAFLFFTNYVFISCHDFNRFLRVYFKSVWCRIVELYYTRYVWFSTKSSIIKNKLRIVRKAGTKASSLLKRLRELGVSTTYSTTPVRIYFYRITRKSTRREREWRYKQTIQINENGKWFFAHFSACSPKTIFSTVCFEHVTRFDNEDDYSTSHLQYSPNPRNDVANEIFHPKELLP